MYFYLIENFPQIKVENLYYSSQWAGTRSIQIKNCLEKLSMVGESYVPKGNKNTKENFGKTHPSEKIYYQ